ncbi:hypothetical protein [Bacillus sp. AFS055030]|uniref:hypothetical protein n=1 Tax=Bacillus sp. AFS055030 TaxID=2033507 RepID=UPI000BFB98ED|nr:hypothetical protein [Bacillus sp. AFS055030]PGL67873.1 hypothetical protein CN925_18090 [Bacillus sp. AFS055030]
MKRVAFCIFSFFLLFLSNVSTSNATSRYLDQIDKHNRNEVHYYVKKSTVIVEQKEFSLINKEKNTNESVVAIAAKYDTVRDRFFKTANYDTYLLDEQTGEILDPGNFVSSKIYDEFINQHKNDGENDFRWKNSLIVLALIFITVVIIPLLTSKLND